MLFSLHQHPSAPMPQIATVQVEVKQTDTDIVLSYQVHGEMASMRVPAPEVNKQRVDGLWAHTCGEAFVAELDEHGYREWNFSPSGQWQAYEFKRYREQCSQPIVVAPQIQQTLEADRLLLQVTIPYPGPQGAILRLGLTMVLENQAQELSYWALQHFGDRPDFHCANTWIDILSRPASMGNPAH
jgi:hypothetical protein